MKAGNLWGKWLQEMVHSLVTVTSPDSEACAVIFHIAPNGTGIFASHVPVNFSHSLKGKYSSFHGAVGIGIKI